jgi:hypothetical protein
MDIETLKRSRAGDKDAQRELSRWLDGLSERDEARLDESLAEIGGEDEHEEEDTPARFWGDLAALKTAVNSTPGAVDGDLAEMADRAVRLGPCETVQVLGLRSYQRRLLSHLDDAEQLLREAFTVGAGCPMRAPHDPETTACGLDLDRRLAILEAALGRPEDGLCRAQRALDGYEILGHPGHDLDRDGIASSHYARGVIRGKLSDYAGAACDYSVCLDRFPPGSPVWERAHQDFTTALARTDHAGREAAWLLQERRRLRISHRKGTTEYAYFYWTDGQLAASLGKQRARKKMKVALVEFASQGMRDEVIGVGHDVAISMWPNRDGIKRFFRRELLPLLKGQPLGRRQVEALNEVIALLRGCPQPETLSLLAPALRRLRAAAGAHLPPCLIAT